MEQKEWLILVRSWGKAWKCRVKFVVGPMWKERRTSDRQGFEINMFKWQTLFRLLKKRRQVHLLKIRSNEFLWEEELDWAFQEGISILRTTTESGIKIRNTREGQPGSFDNPPEIWTHLLSEGSLLEGGAIILGCTQQRKWRDRVWVAPDCTVQKNMMLPELLGQALRRWQLLLLVCVILTLGARSNHGRSPTTPFQGPGGEAETTEREKGGS